jgi:hypothetical protein
MKKFVLCLLVGVLTLGVGFVRASEEKDVEDLDPSILLAEDVTECKEEQPVFEEQPIVEEDVFEEQPVAEEMPVVEESNTDIDEFFLALNAYGFDVEFLKGKEIIIVEKEDGTYVPRYVSHDYKKDPFFKFDNGVMAATSVITFLLTMPLFYRLFHSSKYKEALGDIFALVFSMASSGATSYLTGKIVSEIYKNATEKKKKVPVTPS